MNIQHVLSYTHLSECIVETGNLFPDLQQNALSLNLFYCSIRLGLSARSLRLYILWNISHTQKLYLLCYCFCIVLNGLKPQRQQTPFLQKIIFLKKSREMFPFTLTVNDAFCCCLRGKPLPRYLRYHKIVRQNERLMVNCHKIRIRRRDLKTSGCFKEMQKVLPSPTFFGNCQWSSKILNERVTGKDS